MAWTVSRSRIRRGGVALAAGLSLLGAAIWFSSLIPGRSTSPATVVGQPPVGGAFRLTAHDGRVVSAASFGGKWLLVYFGFTRCVDVCPVTTARMTAVLDRLGHLADGVQPLFISVDPEHDTPAVLADFLRAFDRRILGLTGTPEDVVAAATAYRAYFHRTPDGDVTNHTAIIYVMDPEGRFVTHFTDHVDADHLAARLRALMSAPSK